jgi:hypothetical protein
VDRFIAAALFALALPGSVRADPAEIIDEAPPALEVSAGIVQAFVFGLESGPQRVSPDPVEGVTVVATPAAVLDWVSPIFVWLEPGYAYAETSIAFE